MGGPHAQNALLPWYEREASTIHQYSFQLESIYWNISVNIYVQSSHQAETHAAASLVTSSYIQPDRAENRHCNFCARWEKNKALE